MLEIVFVIGFIWVLSIVGSQKKEKKGSYVKLQKSEYTYDASHVRNTYHRINRCFRCHSTVDSQKDETCSFCQWITCSHCGACSIGCTSGRQVSNKSNEFNEDSGAKNISNIEEDLSPVEYSVKNHRGPRSYCLNSDDFIHQIIQDIKDERELTDYQVKVLIRFRTTLSRSEEGYEIFVELINERYITSSCNKYLLVDLIEKEANRKKDAWWRTINDFIYPIETFDEDPYLDFKYDDEANGQRLFDESMRDVSEHTSGLQESK